MDVSIIQKYVNVAYNIVKARDPAGQLTNKEVENLVTKITSIVFHQICIGADVEPVIKILKDFTNTTQIDEFVKWYFDPALTTPPGVAV